MIAGIEIFKDPNIDEALKKGKAPLAGFLILQKFQVDQRKKEGEKGAERKLVLSYRQYIELSVGFIKMERLETKKEFSYSWKESLKEFKEDMA